MVDELQLSARFAPDRAGRALCFSAGNEGQDYIHAEIALTETGWVVRDTGSTNGTALNGVRIGRSDHRLRVHDLIQCGKVILVVQELEERSASTIETPVDGLLVQAATEQSWEEAVQVLALDMTRRQRPGEQL